MQNNDTQAHQGSQPEPAPRRLDLVIEKDLLRRFFKFMEQGFVVPTQPGCSIEELLCRQLHIKDEYLEERIQTIFLNGKPVDDVKTALITDGSTLALSAAMPGLVGATLRKGGQYARLRRQISLRAEGNRPAHSGAGQVVLKFFNLVAQELGPSFLQNGIWIKGRHLQDFFQRHGDDIARGTTFAQVDAKRIEANRLAEVNWGDNLVFLQL
ncbi:MAG: hypothetical protein JSW39_16090, partial [Desulfobacterales bacterium]